MVDIWEQMKCISEGDRAASGKLHAGADACRANSRKPTRWSKFKRTMMWRGGWDEYDQWDQEQRCIDGHVFVFTGACKMHEFRCKFGLTKEAA